ncbi:hypothetical protein RvY_11077 [Ramazzottius varieornatus]|uniref:Uncharacterized protein n=1 Tax=Ramazzottius varieornatus TaxID=947166 RepID=A0A1D1VJC1_RAMVA|nr:hypothetical protein RvY_11077 [Ramazzottius varieornatus]
MGLHQFVIIGWTDIQGWEALYMWKGVEDKIMQDEALGAMTMYLKSFACLSSPTSDDGDRPEKCYYCALAALHDIITASPATSTDLLAL